MEDELDRAIDVLPGLVWAAQPDRRAWVLNRRWREYTGLDVGQPSDAEWQAAIHPEDLPRWLERWQSSNTSLEPWELELRLRRFDGAYRWFLCRACPESDAPGHAARWWGITTDIDDRRRESVVAEEALNRARSELAHVARITTVSALTASITHEVNQPLSGIITNASTCLRMLDADPPNVDGARETVRRVIRDGNRTADVIKRLRALFSKKEFTLESLDLNDATRELIALSLSDLRRNRVIVHSELASDLPPVTGDRVQLQQVILNLLRNASDAMADVHDRPRELLVTTGREAGDHVRLTVRDTGVGLDPQSIDKLFDAFYSTKHAGMGIGLSVSRFIIERHHGRLWAAPNDGPGATFAFAIPCEPAHPAESDRRWTAYRPGTPSTA